MIALLLASLALAPAGMADEEVDPLGIPCTVDDAITIGSLYLHQSGGIMYVYAESGALEHLQPGAFSPVFGWRDAAYNHCVSTAHQNRLDILVY